MLCPFSIKFLLLTDLFHQKEFRSGMFIFVFNAVIFILFMGMPFIYSLVPFVSVVIKIKKKVIKNKAVLFNCTQGTENSVKEQSIGNTSWLSKVCHSQRDLRICKQARYVSLCHHQLPS